MNEWKCRECNDPVTGIAHLRLGRLLTRGSNALCLTCVDRQMDKMHVNTVHDLVPAYVRANKEQSETALLREEVRQLRALLDRATKPEADDDKVVFRGGRNG